mmetsp:Transcript_126544/g.229794  ORF Transcript_126544/g.229794 Transcript_126544/m.229794 type:complete len:95 (-) Transcript_126544:94-378(-)
MSESAATAAKLESAPLLQVGDSSSMPVEASELLTAAWGKAAAGLLFSARARKSDAASEGRGCSCEDDEGVMTAGLRGAEEEEASSGKMLLALPR